MIPNAHMSTFEVGSFMLMTSGALYATVVSNPNLVYVAEVIFG